MFSFLNSRGIVRDCDVTPVNVYSQCESVSSRREQWLAPIIPAAGRPRLADGLSSGVLSCSGLRHKSTYIWSATAITLLHLSSRGIQIDTSH
uniref:Uncharacterized protein n=1 Tax=Cynoglossus semilaevis TaxID=244447 RepID=A0A3P8X196_CYNSE